LNELISTCGNNFGSISKTMKTEEEKYNIIIAQIF
ncbi:MAG: hypothetical protein K0R46_3082, partial [Herbinix sp.]|nr:hypothetical protein [Herbinix sp.]